jgi:hypothetical protein
VRCVALAQRFSMVCPAWLGLVRQAVRGAACEGRFAVTDAGGTFVQFTIIPDTCEEFLAARG